MWFPDLIWENIRDFLLPVWGRNPWLKKYDEVVDALPLCSFYKQPRQLIKFRHNHSIKFTIYLAYVSWQRHRSSFIKIYTIEYI